MDMSTLRVSAGLADKYRSNGWWRDTGLITDLRRWRDASPDAVAIDAFASEGHRTTITYREYAHLVERFAGALCELGVRPGQVVAMQLPNWWQACALYLAATRLHAVIAPVMTTIRRRELERLLARVGAGVFVTVDRWDGFDHADLARPIAPDVPDLRKLVVLGQTESDSEIDFGEFFEDTAWEQRHPVALDDAEEDPDAVSIVLFTSGTSGQPKAVLGTQDTWHAACSGRIEAESITEADAIFTPNSTMGSLGTAFSIYTPLQTGALSILLDSWSGATGLAVLERARVAVMMAGARYYDQLVAAAVERPTRLPSLRVIAATGTKIPGRLVKSVIETWVCLATARGADNQLTVTSEHDDGWYDTGDLAACDGQGGIRLVGRVADRIGKGFVIPVADVEDQLMRHPTVADVAVVGYLDGHDFEYPCAVITVRGETTATLDELHEYLTEQGMTEWYQPTRLERLKEPPRNSSGKIRKELLRSWLNGVADLQNLS